VFVSNGFASLTSGGFVYGSQAPPDWTQEGLVAYYPFDGDTLDRGPFKNNLLNTGATLSADRFGNPDKCYQFNGTTSWMVSESNLPIKGAEPRTFALWLKIPSKSSFIGNPSIIEHGLKVAQASLFSVLLSPLKPTLFVHGSYFDRGMNESLPSDQWFHASVSTDGTSQGTKFYINGEAASDSGEYSGFYQTVETKLRISTFRDSGGISNDSYFWWESGFKGWIDEIRIYRRALSHREIRDIYLLEKNEPIGLIWVGNGSLPGSSFVGAVSVNAFYIGKTEVTWGEWKAVRDWAAANGYTDLAGVGQGLGDNYPVTHVNWYDVVKWCNARSEMEGKTPVYMNGANVYRTGEVLDPPVNSSANGYRLPTEAEWEFAARGGTQTQEFAYSGSNNLDEVGWYNGNSGSAVREVGMKLANELGIYDMSGNLWEWCGSWYPGSEGSYRVLRGGVWHDSAEYSAVSYRHLANPGDRSSSIGFRVALRSAP
jgi:sulfatase modifying factor 1